MLPAECAGHLPDSDKNPLVSVFTVFGMDDAGSGSGILRNDSDRKPIDGFPEKNGSGVSGLANLQETGRRPGR